jgi:hypothetical protein
VAHSNEPAIIGLENWLKIENKEHSEFRHLFQAIEFTGNSQVSATRLIMEFTRCWTIFRRIQDFSFVVVVDGDSAICHYSRIHSGDMGVFRD